MESFGQTTGKMRPKAGNQLFVVVFVFFFPSILPVSKWICTQSSFICCCEYSDYFHKYLKSIHGLLQSFWNTLVPRRCWLPVMGQEILGAIQVASKYQWNIFQILSTFSSLKFLHIKCELLQLVKRKLVTMWQKKTLGLLTTSSGLDIFDARAEVGSSRSQSQALHTLGTSLGICTAPCGSTGYSTSFM